MNAPQVQMTPGAVLAVAGIGVLAYAAWKASSVVGDTIDEVSDAVSEAAGEAAQWVYPESLLSKNETVTGKLEKRYEGTNGVIDFLSRAWDGYWQDVNSLWGSVGDSYLSDAEAIKARNTYATTDPRRVDAGGGASGSW